MTQNEVSTQEIIIRRKIKIASFEQKLGIRFLFSYRQFLLEKGSAVVDGFKIIGLPTKQIPMSVLEGTQILRSSRKDLATKPLIAIAFDKDRALCLDLERGAEKDAPLIDVSLKDESVLPVSNSFQRYIKEKDQKERRFREAYQRIVDRRKETENWRRQKFSHEEKGLLPRPQDWHPIISRVQDYIVGMTALRHNPSFNYLEVDEFYASDHPNYKPGEAIRNLTRIIFTMARDFSGSLNIAFTEERRDKKPSFFRPSRPIPRDLVQLASQYEVTFKKEREGKISHQEGVKLYFALLEFPPEIQRTVGNLEEAGYLSKEMIGEVISAGIWSREEVIWLFENVSRPEAILLGSAVAENRPFHAEAVNYARSVLLATRLKQVIMVDMRGGFSPEEKEGIEITLEPKEKFWILRGNEKFRLSPSWIIDQSEVWVEPEEPVLLLSRPRLIARPDYNKAWLKGDVELLLNSRIEAKVRCLLVNYEFISPDYNPDVEGIKALVKEAGRKGVHILFPSTRTPLLLDEEIEKRMRIARAIREFPLRGGPLKLMAFEIPAYDWDIPSGARDITRDSVVLRNASRDAVAFAGYILDKVDIHRCRRQLSFNCEVVERIAPCHPKSRRIAEFEGKESEELLAALKGRGSYETITFSYVRPNEMAAFLRRVNVKVRGVFKKVQGGVVVVTIPYEAKEVPVVKVESLKPPVRSPEIVTAKIDLKIVERIDGGKYVSQEWKIKSAHEQIREALATGLPLAASYIQPSVFVETIRNYLYYHTYLEERKERFLWFFSRRKKYERREPPKPAMLRIVYGDGSEGIPFSLFCLREDFQKPKKENLFELHVSLVSLRHMQVDYFAEVSLIRNVEIQNRENAAEQEDIAFRKTHYFLENFIKLLRGEIEIDAIRVEEKKLHCLWKKFRSEKKKAKGIELHIYQATGLEPATIGAYRAAVELLKKYRGHLVVVSRIFTNRAKEKVEMFTPKEKFREIQETDYPKAEEWF